jgi:hypothetical protein
MYRFKISLFVFDIIEIECEFDYSIFSEISPWAYSRVFTVNAFFETILKISASCKFGSTKITKAMEAKSTHVS